MKKKVYLVDLGTGTDRNLLPLSIGLIASYAMGRPELAEAYDIELLFLREDPKRTVQGMSEPVIVAFAAYVWNFRASLNLARIVRQRFPHTKIVFGGYSIPKDPLRMADFFLQNPHVDILVHNEGEVTFSHLLEALAEKQSLVKVNGITFQTCDIESGFHTTPRQERIKDLDTIPSPFLNGVFDTLMTKYGSSVTGAVWETNRGCPYSCTFCDWGNADVNKVIKYGAERLHEELIWLSKKNIYYIYGADANFGIFFERDFELAGKVADLCSKTGFPGYLMINWLKNSHERIVSIADRLSKGGVLTNVTMAVQSMNKDVLEAIKRRNISQESMAMLKKAFHDKGLPTYIELILGLPRETYESFVAGLNSVMTNRLDDHFVIYPCTLLENTEMVETKYRAAYGIESRFCKIGMSRRGFENYEEMEEILVGTTSMPIDQWKRAYVMGYVVTALYNHRVAFFIMNYLQRELGNGHTDFVEFLLSAVEADSEGYPRLSMGIKHIQIQGDLIVDGISYMSSPVGLENLVLTPHEACASILLGNSDELYRELRKIVGKFVEIHCFEVDPLILDEVVYYQKIVMPSWPVRTEKDFLFETNVPELFKELTLGSIKSQIEMRQTLVSVESRAPIPKNYHEFASRLVRAGHTLQLVEHSVSSPLIEQV